MARAGHSAEQIPQPWQAAASAPGFETLVEPSPIRIVAGRQTTHNFILTRSQPEPPPSVRERIQKMIRRDIGRLPGGAPHRHHGGQTDEEPQIAVPGRPMQHPGAVDLGPRDAGHGVRRRLAESIHSGDTGGVNHPLQGMRAGVDRREQVADLRLVGDIKTLDPNGQPRRLECGHPTPSLIGLGAPPSDETERTDAPTRLETLTGRVELAALRGGPPLAVEAGQGVVVQADGTMGPVRPLLPAPRALRPLRGEAPADAHLRWTPVEGAVAYRVEIARDAELVYDVRTWQAAGPAAEVPGALPPGRWYWRAAATDEHGLVGRPTKVHAFTAGGEAAPP